MDHENMIEELSKIVGKENVLSSETDLMLYGYDASLFRGKPDCIVLPGSTEEVSRVVKFAHKEGIHVVARGSGNNLSQVFDPPRNILQSIPGLKLVEMANNRQLCVCGGGGGGSDILPAMYPDDFRLCKKEGD